MNDDVLFHVQRSLTETSVLQKEKKETSRHMSLDFVSVRDLNYHARTLHP